MAAAKDQNPEKDPAPDAAASDATPVFSVERLIAESIDLLGQPSFVVAGALYGTKKSLTVVEAEAAVKAWLKA